MNLKREAGASANASAGITLRSQNYTDIFREAKACARNFWSDILSDHGLSQYLKRKHGPCPLCGGKDRFRFDNKNGDGTWYCNQCGAGDGLKLLSQWLRLTVLEAAQMILGKPLSYAQYPTAVINAQEPSERREKNLQRIWRDSKPLDPDTAAFKYLVQTRALSLKSLPHDLRCHPSLEYWHDGKQLGSFPALVAGVRSVEGKLVSLHRTFLDQEGRKAHVPQAKKLMPPAVPGATRGAAVRLYQPSEVLGLAEGIETAIACHLATNLPTWSTVSAGGMESVHVPSSVKIVVIFADNDKSQTGEKAARKLANRLMSDGKQVKILLPHTAGTDWCDVAVGGISS